MKFLIVDSDRSRYEELQKMLEQTSLATSNQIFHAPDLKDAFKIIESSSIEFIFLNCSTSRIPVAPIRQLRMTASHTPLVALVSQAQAKKASDLIRAGADDYAIYAELDKSLLVRMFRYVMTMHHEAHAKAELFANLSVEMRAPLHLILGTSDLLAETELDTRQKKLIHTLYASSRRLQTLLGTAFNLSQSDLKATEHSAIFEHSDIKEFHKLLYRPFTQSKIFDLFEQFIPGPSQPYFGDQELNILVVDDDLENHKLISAFMENTTCQITFASDGYEALNLAKKKNFDLILLDIEMPGLNGYETAEMLKPLQLLERCKILGLSAKALPQDIIQARKSGFSGYLTKPISKQSLLHSISECLKADHFFEMAK